MGASAKQALKINEENRLVKLNQDISNESKEEEKIEKTDAESAQQPDKNNEIKIAKENIHLEPEELKNMKTLKEVTEMTKSYTEEKGDDCIDEHLSQKQHDIKNEVALEEHLKKINEETEVVKQKDVEPGKGKKSSNENKKDSQSAAEEKKAQCNDKNTKKQQDAKNKAASAKQSKKTDEKDEL